MTTREIYFLLRSSVSVQWSAMRPNKCSHGPQDWTNRLIAFAFVRLEWMILPDKPCLGWRLWVYTRGAAWTLDLYIEAPAELLTFGERMARLRRQRQDSERIWSLLKRPVAAAVLLLAISAPARATYTVDVTTAGPVTTGTVVTSTPSGIVCPPTCSAVFATSETVTLGAVVPSTMAFSDWGGTYCRTNSPICTILLTTNIQLTATYNPVIDLTISGNGIGVLTSSGTPTSTDTIRYTNGAGGQLRYGASARIILPNGSTVTVTASTGAYSAFTGWSGAAGCASASTCTVTMDGYHAIVATFTASAAAYPLRVVMSPLAGGVVVSSPTGINCPGVCTSTFTAGVSVSLTTTAASGYRFLGWANAGCAKNLPCVVTSTSPLQGIGGKDSPAAFFAPVSQ